MAKLDAVRVVVAGYHHHLALRPPWSTWATPSTWSVRWPTPTRPCIEVIATTTPRPRRVRPPHARGRRIKVARTCGEDVPIVMLTVSEAERDLLDAVAAGAAGYLGKSTPSDECGASCGRRPRASRSSPPAWPPSCSGSSDASTAGAGPRARPSGPEREALQHVAKGHTYRQIGEDPHRREDRREPRAQHPGQAPPVREAGAHPLRAGALHRVRPGHRCPGRADGSPARGWATTPRIGPT